MIHLAPERMGLGKSHADVESLTITSTSDRRSAQGNTFQLAGLPVLVGKIQRAATDIRSRHFEFTKNWTVPRIPDDDNFLSEFMSGRRLGCFCSNVKTERPDIVFAVIALQAFDDELPRFFREVQDVFVVGLDGLVVSDGSLIMLSGHFIDDCGEVAEESVIISLVVVFLIKFIHRLLGSVHFDHGAIDILLREVVHDLHFMENQHFKWASPVRTDVVVCDNGGSFVCNGSCIKFIVNLVGLVEVGSAFRIVPAIVVKNAQVKVIKKFCLFTVKVFVMLFDFANCRLNAFIFKNRRESFIARHGLVCTGREKDCRDEE